MDPRRNPRSVSDPKVRQVGFFAPPPDRSQSGPPDHPISSSAASSPPPPPPAPAPTAAASSVSAVSPSGNSLSPVMIPPPRHHSDNLALLSRPVPVPFPTAPSSYTPGSDFSPSSAAAAASSYSGKPAAAGAGTDGELGDDVAMSPGRVGRGRVMATSVPASGLTTVSVVTMPSGITEKVGGASVEVQNERPANSKPQKEKMTKAERRALQEAQRAAKAAAKGEGSKAARAAPGAVLSEITKPNKAVKPSQKKSDSASVAPSEKKGPGAERPPEKERKKDVPHPRMQYDDESRVEKAKRKAVVKQTEARNRVELFRHLPQYEHGSQLPDLESKFFQLELMHPAVYKVGLHYLYGDVCGGNARCIAMLKAFQEVINEYSTPPEKTLSRDLTAKISSYVSFFTECRPLSVSMGNAIRFLKSRIAKLPLTMSELEAKATLHSDIDHFINEKIILADKVMVSHAVTKIRDGDVLLTYGSPSAVEMILLHAHELGKQFRVVVVDSRPKLEGQLLLRRLVGKGINCTYININAVSYIMHEVTRVFLGASAVLSNGTVYSRVGTACVAMVAHAFRVPVLVCCEAYKFHERVQLDSICCNELGDPDVISKVPGREESVGLDGLPNSGNLQLLNLMSPQQVCRSLSENIEGSIYGYN
ncbi:uncharacterized protein LOC115686189 isoform X2 [Syzygium oleosum]|uniref:uncharacterized protein LOC115686189 isoform X2 n=1 Tax=Syzygium oleosum TaxID=219896 RepID=UPI0024B8E521|nr:uncharacterized protein LOC115686189 isoform X2 [Syzygium oleosum]